MQLIQLQKESLKNSGWLGFDPSAALLPTELVSQSGAGH